MSVSVHQFHCRKRWRRGCATLRKKTPHSRPKSKDYCAREDWLSRKTDRSRVSPVPAPISSSPVSVSLSIWTGVTGTGARSISSFRLTTETGGSTSSWRTSRGIANTCASSRSRGGWCFGSGNTKSRRRSLTSWNRHWRGFDALELKSAGHPADVIPIP